MCKEVGAAMMLECSAKTAIGVEELFDNAVRVALCAREPLRKPAMKRMKAKVHRDNKHCLHVTRYNHGMVTRARTHTHTTTHTHTYNHTHNHTHTTTHTQSHAVSLCDMSGRSASH